MKPQIWILFFFVSFSAVLGVLFTPALPGMAKDFNVSGDTAELLISLFLFGYTFGQLIYGPIAKAKGRKPAIYTTSVLSIVGSLISLIAAYSLSFSLMLFGRIVAAIGSSGGLTLSFTLITDTYSSLKAKKKISLILLSFGVLPSIAIFIGGYLTEILGWESCFIAMLI